MAVRGVADDTQNRIGGNAVERSEEDIEMLVLYYTVGEENVEAIGGGLGGSVLVKAALVRVCDGPDSTNCIGIDLTAVWI